MRNLRFHLRESPIYRGIEIFISEIFPNGDIAIVKPAIVEIIKADDFAPMQERDPALIVDSKEQLQSLMDGLWQLGVRPSDIGTPGHLAATTHHLNDMRKLVAKTLGIEL